MHRESRLRQGQNELRERFENRMSGSPPVESNPCTDRLSRNKKVGSRNAVVGVPELVRLYTDASRRLTSSGTVEWLTAVRKSSRMASQLFRIRIGMRCYQNSG